MSRAHAERALKMLQRAKERGLASEVSIERPGSPGGYNTETGAVEGASAPTVHTGVGLKVGYQQGDIDGALIREGDQQLYADAIGLPRPLTQERVTVAGATYTIESVEVLAPGDTDVLYILRIRGV